MPNTDHLHWGAEALWQQLEPLLPGLSVEVVARLGSTNTELLDRVRNQAVADDGAGERLGDTAAAAPDKHFIERRSPGRRETDTQPCLLVAEHQTRGRGRQGKAWQSSIGASLTFSLALPLAPVDWSGLSLAVGLVLADIFDPLPPGGQPRLGIKWPNDLLLMAPAATGSAIGRKLGGVLIETVQVGGQRMVVVGIGLNLLPQPEHTADGALSWGYACLQELHDGLTAPAALAQLALPLVQALRAFERDGFAPLQARFAARDVLLGRPVSTTLPDLPTGIADGVDATGTLWLQVAGQRRPVASGEVSLRAVPDAGPAAAPC